MSTEEEEAGPRTPLEEILVEIWTEILDLEWVGIHDNFFRIGGHSLLATQLLVHIQDILNIEIPLQLFFDAPTIADLATAIMNNESIREHVEKTIELLLSISEL
jgi:acyl carrier protein